MKTQLAIGVGGLADTEALYYAAVSKEGEVLGKTGQQAAAANNNAAVFSELVELDDEECTLEIAIYAAADDAVVAQTSFDVASIANSYTQTAAKNSEQGPNIALHATEQTQGKLALILQAHDLPNTDFGFFNSNQKTDPIYEIHNYHGKKMKRSNKVEDDLNPIWDEMELELEALCGKSPYGGGNNLGTPLRITVYDRDGGDSAEYLGNVTMSVKHMVFQGGERVHLVKGGVHVGDACLSVHKAELLPDEVVGQSAQAALKAALSALANLEALKEEAAAQQQAAEAAQAEAEAAQQAAVEKQDAADILAAAQLQVKTKFSDLAKKANETETKAKDHAYSGQLVFTLAAFQLPDVDFGIRNKTDGVFEVFLEDTKLVTSNKVGNDLNPVWEEQSFDLHGISSLDDTKIKVVVSDKDGETELTALGEWETTVKGLLEAGESHKAITLEKQYKKNSDAKLVVKAAKLENFQNLQETLVQLKAECEALKAELDSATEAFSAAQKEANEANKTAADAAEAAEAASQIAKASQAAVEMAEKAA